MSGTQIGGDTARDRFDLARFERLARAGDRAALPILRQILMHIELDGDLNPTNAPGRAGLESLFRRMTTAIADMLSSSGLDLTLADGDWLALHSRHLSAIFSLAWPDGPDRVYRRVRDAHGAAATGAALRKVLAAASIAATIDLDWRHLLEREPESAVAPFLANFTHRGLLDAEADLRRNALFALAPLLEPIPLRPGTVGVLAEAWMLCSYATHPQRHSIKPYLNAMVRGLLAPVSPPKLPEPRERDDLPTIVVFAEVLFARHAVFKAYAFFLRQLRPRFHLTLVTLTGHVDEAGQALFDETFAFQSSPNVFDEITDKITSLRPAIVYYPSVGMSQFTVLLCNLRLAPIQIVSTGHAATTHSEAMDYMVTGHEHFGGEDRFSEQVVLLRSGGALFVPERGLKTFVPRVRRAPNVLRVAVTDSPLKLNPPFIDLCRRIAQAAERPIEYHLFSNLIGVRLRDFRRQMAACLEGAVVHPRLEAGPYQEHINRCDVRFGSFPVGGGTASTDAVLQGLPSVVFEGPEPHSRTDKRFVHMFGMPEWLIARSEREYEQAALLLISDDGERCRLAHQILDADPEATLFAKEQDLYPTDFADTFFVAL